MKLFIGLGNPGPEYIHTRHNAGFMFVEYAAKHFEAQAWQHNKKLFAETTETYIDDHKFFFAKPDTFMNNSGRAASALMNYYKVASEDVIVVHDDLDIAFGNYKIHRGRGPKVHNGVNSVESALQTSDFWRIRIGVENRTDVLKNVPGGEFVLQKFTSDEITKLPEIFSECLTSYLDLLKTL